MDIKPWENTVLKETEIYENATGNLGLASGKQHETDAGNTGALEMVTWDR